MPSSTVENYLKQILVESLQGTSYEVGMGKIADCLGVTPGTATTMVKSMESKGWVKYRPRKGVKLTTAGRKVGMNMLRRHRLLETFLVETLGLDWGEIHEEAEVLEHAISEKVLEEYLKGDKKYLEAYSEVEENNIQNKELWAKAFAQCGGDKEKQKSIYVELRTKELSKG